MTRKMIALCLCGLTWMMVGCGGEEPEEGTSEIVSGIPPKVDTTQAVGHLSPDEDSLVEACIRATACDVKPYPRVSNCKDYYGDMLVPLGLAKVYDGIYTCTNGASTCAQVKACFGVTETCDGSYPARCDNGRAVFCDLLDKTTFAYDCAGAGLTCELDPQYGFAATCSGEAASPSALTSTLECQGDMCQRTSEPCQEDALDRCDGDNLQACLDGEWVSFDCVALGLGACQREAGGWARCGAR